METSKEQIRDERYTPRYIFDALRCGTFDMDVAAPYGRKTHVDARLYVHESSLCIDWVGFVWCNPPYGKAGSKMPWAQKMVGHGNGLMLMPDRTQTDWWRYLALNCHRYMVLAKKVKFGSPFHLPEEHPQNGSTLFAFGDRACAALFEAEKNKLGLALPGRFGMKITSIGFV